MCLTVSKEKRNLILAEEDIICYKILFDWQPHLNKICYCSPYQYKLYTKLNIVYNNKTPIDKRRKKSEYQIFGGCYHSFANYDDAINEAICLIKTISVRPSRRPLCCENVVIFKCIIPKGTKYYEGVFDGNEVSYASKSIYFSEIVATIKI